MPTNQSRSFNVVAPAISAEAIILNGEGKLIAVMSNIGRTREQVVEDARFLSFSGKLHQASTNHLAQLSNTEQQLAAVLASPALPPEQRSALEGILKGLTASRAQVEHVVAGAMLRGDAAMHYDLREDDRHSREAYAAIERPDPKHLSAREAVDQIEVDRMRSPAPGISLPSASVEDELSAAEKAIEEEGPDRLRP